MVCFFIAVLVLYAIGLELDDRFGWLIGLVAVLFTLTAHPVLTNSALAMLELPGLLVSFLTLWAYLRALKQGMPKRLGVVSVLLASTVLVKYPYGLIMGATVGVMEILRLFSAPGQFSDIWKRWFWLFGPFGVIMLIWFYQPQKLPHSSATRHFSPNTLLSLVWRI